MDVYYFQELYDYNYWQNRRVWKCILALTDAQFDQDLEYSHGSLRMQSIHVMAVEDWWVRFLQEGVIKFVNLDDLPDRPAIRAKWDEVESYVHGYLQTLTAAEMERKVLPPFWENKPAVTVWQALTQVAMHSMDHRAQILAALHRLGAPTVGQDYLEYLFEKQPG